MSGIEIIVVHILLVFILYLCIPVNVTSYLLTWKRSIWNVNLERKIRKSAYQLKLNMNKTIRMFHNGEHINEYSINTENNGPVFSIGSKISWIKVENKIYFNG